MIRLLYSKTPQLVSPILRHFCDLRTYSKFLQSTPAAIIRAFSSDNKTTVETSFTVSYLINSCGLSQEAANSASKRVQFETVERPNSGLALLHKYGFSNPQITKIVKLYPLLLLADPEKTIFPKLMFFSSIGISSPDIIEIISSKPGILTHSLRNRIIPVYEFLKSALLFDDDMVNKAMRRGSRIFQRNVERVSAPNLLFLREIGMPQSSIQLLLIHHTNLLLYKVDMFREKIKEVMNMGFYPTETKFIHALASMLQLSESNWEHKIEVYGRCGWSEADVMFAFKKAPEIMTFSEKKIIGCMDFLVNVMDMKPSEIAGTPYLLCYSTKKRIIPRGLVIKILKSKGALEKNICFSTVVGLTNKCFLERYMDKHREHIPYLQDVFEGRMCPQELGLQYGQKFLHECPLGLMVDDENKWGCPQLKASLRNRIIPGYEFLMNALLFDDDMVIKAMSNQSRILRQDVEKISASNLLFLRQIGTPQSLIQQILMHHPSVLCHKADKFHDKIKELIDMGFCPTGMKFIYALQAILLNESYWQRKIEVYGRCGWSKDEILKAFKKDPRCMRFSEKKIIGTVHFLDNVMDLKPSAVAANPLKKRTIPRRLVFKTLMLKGVLKKKTSFRSVLLLTDKCFLKMYIDKHLEDIPYLLDVFDVMFALLYTKTPQSLSPILRYFCDLSTHLRLLQCTPVIINRSFSSTISSNKEQPETGKNLFTVFPTSLNSCGYVTTGRLYSASKRVQFLTPERPNSVLALLNQHGFTNFQIAKLVKYDPGFLLADPEKTIFPKLKFFYSVGITGPDLAKIISVNPSLLRHSLPNFIIPAYKFVRSALLFDDDMVIRALRPGSRILLYDVAPNLLVLREIGMTQSLINMLLAYHSSLICHKVDKFRDKVKEVINMGFCPTKTKFVHALHAIISISESNWQHKIELYGRYGWSKDEMLSVFKKHPLCMTLSEKKIIGVMDFLVNFMDMKPSKIAASPYLFTSFTFLASSLKKR
ncbi:uncharacterized protein LOC105628383 [Jatropha curcas]|uniref:uncharacterized protein LOC105628383 n=1 Tax=Jatropha curcas TaxID=180498 RepID=UPI0018943A6F|nr:uncharacterized protein LOC105628383 [Jatropha curcas]